RPRQQIRGAAARHEAGAATHAEAAAFGFLQQHRADQHGDDHEMNDDNDSLHCKPSVTSQKRPDHRRWWLCGFREVARCYTIGPGIVTPEIVAGAGMTSRLLRTAPALN